MKSLIDMEIKIEIYTVTGLLSWGMFKYRKNLNFIRLRYNRSQGILESGA